MQVKPSRKPEPAKPLVQSKGPFRLQPDLWKGLSSLELTDCALPSPSSKDKCLLPAAKFPRLQELQLLQVLEYSQSVLPLSFPRSSPVTLSYIQSGEEDDRKIHPQPREEFDQRKCPLPRVMPKSLLFSFAWKVRALRQAPFPSSVVRLVVTSPSPIL